MFLAKKITNHTLLPVLIVLLVLSIEAVVMAILEFIEFSFPLLDSNLLSYSDEFVDLVILTFSKGIGILVLILLLTQKVRPGEIKASPKINVHTTLIGVLIYVGCIIFLIENLNSSLLIFPEKDPIIKVWPEIIMSRMSINYMGYQVILIFLLLFVLPIFEELLYRKAVIQALLMKQIKSGWILVISSLIYAISPFISNLVWYSETQALWDLTIRIISGLILAFFFLNTQKVKYPILLRSLVNCVIYFQFLTMFHPIFSPFKELYLFLILILTSIGIFIFFYLLFDGIATFRSSSSLPPWSNSFLDFRFSEDILKPLFSSILILLPLFPFGLIIFVDHTVIYGDYIGILIKTIIKISILGILILICGIQIKTNKELYEACSETNTSLVTFLQKKFLKIRDNFTPRAVLHNFGILILVIGAIIPILIISMEATIFTSVPIIGRIIEINMEMATGQAPLLSFSQTRMTSQSNLFWMIPMQKTEETIIYFLKHTNGKWYFLPDTFMSHPGDWLHGLMTVGAWFLFLLLLYFMISEYMNQRKIVAGASSIALIVVELVWLLFTFGFGSIPAEAEPPTPTANQTISQLIRMDFEMQSFLILPLGLILLLLGTFIILIPGIQNYRRRKKNFEQDRLKNEESEKLRDSNDVSSTKDDSFSEELEINGDTL
ncbi:MAG: CPBP family intramembrane glutamic endopeptidase [Candidatus Hodarchaeota archaeon]